MPGPHGEAFSGRVGWGARPAVLVVDLVRAYTADGGPFALPDPGPAVAATAALVAAARAGAAVVVASHDPVLVAASDAVVDLED